MKLKIIDTKLFHCRKLVSETHEQAKPSILYDYDYLGDKTHELESKKGNHILTNKHREPSRIRAKMKLNNYSKEFFFFSTENTRS